MPTLVILNLLFSTHILRSTWLHTMQAMYISMHTHTSQSLLNAINPIYEKSNGFASNGSTHFSTLLIYLINEPSKQRAITQASSTSYFTHKRWAHIQPSLVSMNLINRQASIHSKLNGKLNIHLLKPTHWFTSSNKRRKSREHRVSFTTHTCDKQSLS